MRKDSRDQAREEAGHSTATGTFQKFQGRWAGKDQGKFFFLNPGNVPEVINELRRGMLWKQRAREQHAPAAQRSLRSPAFPPTHAAHPEQERFTR